MKRALKSVIIGSVLTLIMMSFSSQAFAGNRKSEIYEGFKKDGSVLDRCLNTGIPITIRKVDHHVYYVNVKNGWSGQVKASGYGDARNQACNKKSHRILYGFEGNEPFK